MSDLNGMGGMLWWTANVLLSVLAIAIVFYDGFGLAVMVWLIGFFILMAVRPI